MIVYDIETKKGIQKNLKLRKLGYEYAEGWTDYEGMGIAVLALYDYKTGEYRHFSDSKEDIEKVNEIFNGARLISGFNIENFDNPLARANGITIDDDKCYDVMKQLWYATGSPCDKNGKPTYWGLSLNKVLECNFENIQKSMNGADAPIFWQDRKYQEVIDYCLDDVKLERMPLEKILITGGLISPKSKKFVRMSTPTMR